MTKVSFKILSPGGGGMAINDPVSGGTTNSMLYVNGSGDLAQVQPSATGQIVFYNELGELGFEAIPALPAIQDFLGADVTPPGGPSDGDAYVLYPADAGTGYSPYSGMMGNIQWQSGNTVRYNVADTTTMFVYESFPHTGTGDTVLITGATDPLHNGRFVMTAWDSGTGYFEVTNPAITNNTHDELASPAISYWTDAAWNGAAFRDWVRYNATAGTWNWITPINGQTILNIQNNQTYVFKNGVWSSQAYVLPPQPYSIRILCEPILAMNTTADQAISIGGPGGLPGTTGFTKYMALHCWLYNVETVIGTADDLQFWTGAGRTGTHLWTFTAAELAQLTFSLGVPIGFAYHGPPDGNVLIPNTIYASLGTDNGTVTAIRCRIAGWPQY